MILNIMFINVTFMITNTVIPKQNLTYHFTLFSDLYDSLTNMFQIVPDDLGTNVTIISSTNNRTHL